MGLLRRWYNARFAPAMTLGLKSNLVEVLPTSVLYLEQRETNTLPVTMNRSKIIFFLIVSGALAIVCAGCCSAGRFYSSKQQSFQHRPVRRLTYRPIHRPARRPARRPVRLPEHRPTHDTDQYTDSHTDQYTDTDRHATSTPTDTPIPTVRRPARRPIHRHRPARRPARRPIHRHRLVRQPRHLLQHQHLCHPALLPQLKMQYRSDLGS